MYTLVILASACSQKSIRVYLPTSLVEEGYKDVFAKKALKIVV